MANFKNTTQLEKYQLQALTDAVRNYVQMVEKLPEGSRLRKVKLEFTGARFKPTDIQVRFVRSKVE